MRAAEPATAAGRLLTTRDVGHRFPGGPWLFRHLDLRFSPGTVTALTGPSGTGKSTLLAILAGSLRPAEGEVSRHGIRAVVKVTQAAHGVPQRAGLDHICLPMLAAGLSRREAEVTARAIGARFGLVEQLDQPYAQLSGGEGQRLMLARAMARRADLILADEPTASLDYANAQGVINILGSLADDGAVVVVATHDSRARDACHAVLDLSTAGRLAASGD